MGKSDARFAVDDRGFLSPNGDGAQSALRTRDSLVSWIKRHGPRLQCRRSAKAMALDSGWTENDVE